MLSWLSKNLNVVPQMMLQKKVAVKEQLYRHFDYILYYFTIRAYIAAVLDHLTVSAKCLYVDHVTINVDIVDIAQTAFFPMLFLLVLRLLIQVLWLIFVAMILVFCSNHDCYCSSPLRLFAQLCANATFDYRFSILETSPF